MPKRYNPRLTLHRTGARFSATSQLSPSESPEGKFDACQLKRSKPLRVQARVRCALLLVSSTAMSGTVWTPCRLMPDSGASCGAQLARLRAALAAQSHAGSTGRDAAASAAGDEARGAGCRWLVAFGWPFSHCSLPARSSAGFHTPCAVGCELICRFFTLERACQPSQSAPAGTHALRTWQVPHSDRRVSYVYNRFRLLPASYCCGMGSTVLRAGSKEAAAPVGGLAPARAAEPYALLVDELRRCVPQIHVSSAGVHCRHTCIRSPPATSCAPHRYDAS